MGKRRTEEAQELARRLGVCIKTARGERTQAWLAEAIGAGDQSTVSDYEVGRSRVNLDQVVAIEDALGLHRGQLLVASGYVPEVQNAEDAIKLDPNLTDRFDRQALLLLYSIYLERKPSAD